MKISKDQFIKEFQKKAEEWKGCTDERGTYSSLYYLVLSSLEEFEAARITSPYIETAFYKAVSEDVTILRDVLYSDYHVDVVEVVRCKDCEKWLKCEPSGTNCRVCAYTTKIRLPYDFCSYGKRKGR